MAQARTWKCPTCGLGRKAKFCPTCGEERLRPKDLTLADTTAQFFKNVTSVDGKLLRSYHAVVASPGGLTVAHVRGQRRDTLGPLSLFFVANAVFAALQSYLGLNVLSSPLESHLHDQDWRSLANTLVDDRLRSTGQSLAAYSAVFDQAVIFNAKALMILMALLFAPIVWLVFPKPHRTSGVHAVFSLHVYTFVLTLLCLSLLLTEGDRMLGGGGMRSPVVDLVLSLANLGACALYIYVAIGAVYGSSGLARMLKAAGLAISVATLFVAYRFGMFLVTLYTT